MSQGLFGAAAEGVGRPKHLLAPGTRDALCGVAVGRDWNIARGMMSAELAARQQVCSECLAYAEGRRVVYEFRVVFDQGVLDRWNRELYEEGVEPEKRVPAEVGDGRLLLRDIVRDGPGEALYLLDGKHVPAGLIVLIRQTVDGEELPLR